MRRHSATGWFIALALVTCWCSCSPPRPPVLEAPEPLRYTGPNQQALDHFISGVVFEQQGELTRAISEYRRALQYDSSASTIYLSLAEDYYLLKLYDDAIFYLQAALNVDSTDLRTLEFLNDVLLENNQLDSAAVVAQKLIRLNPQDTQYRTLLATIYLRSARPQEALTQYEEILKVHPEDLETLGQISAVYLTLKDFEKALEISLRMATLDSSNDRVNFTIASLLAELKRPQEADQYFARTVALNPDDPRYFTNWAFLHMGEKNFHQAIRILTRGTQQHPKAAEIWALLGSAYERSGQDSLALKTLDRALELDASQLGPYITLGFIYDNRGDYSKALEVYNQALSIAPEDPLLLNNYAYLLAQRKERLDEALRMVQKALAKSPDNPSYLDTIGWVYFNLGDFQLARGYIEQALAQDQQNSAILDHLGDIYGVLGDKAKARECWLKALESDQSNVKIREKLAQ